MGFVEELNPVAVLKIFDDIGGGRARKLQIDDIGLRAERY